MFLKEGIKKEEESPLPDVKYHSIETGLKFITEYVNKGVSNFLLFGVPKEKSVDVACNKGIIIEFIKKAKEQLGNKIKIFADVGLSPYASDGHSVIIKNGKVDQEASYKEGIKLAIAFGKAGADYVAPCLSLPFQVKKIREALDKNKLNSTKILSYSAKFASVFYGPYRNTIESPLKSDKKLYQTDYDNDKEALKQIKDDEAQGADIVMVKPAMMYLDIVYQAKHLTKLPLAVYNISGEYTALKLTAKSGAINENEAFDELHSAFQRCGVDYVIGYAPDHFLRWKEQQK